MKNVGNSSRGRSEGVMNIFRAPYRAHCAVIFATAQLSCTTRVYCVHWICNTLWCTTKVKLLFLHQLQQNMTNCNRHSYFTIAFVHNCRKNGIKYTISTEICCHTTSRNWTPNLQLVRKVIQCKCDAKSFVYSKCLPEMFKLCFICIICA